MGLQLWQQTRVTGPSSFVGSKCQHTHPHQCFRRQDMRQQVQLVSREEPMTVQHISASVSAEVRESANLQKQLATKESFVHILWVNPLTVPQKPGEVTGIDLSSVQLNLFTSSVSDNVS